MTIHIDRYTEIAYQALRPVTQSLFQARKVGVYVDIPEPVRQKMLAAHGQEAANMLVLLDGRVSLAADNGVSVR